MMLPDPRQWLSLDAATQVSHLLPMALASLRGEVAARATLRLELDALMDAGGDSEVHALLRAAPSAECYRHLRQLLAKLVNKPERGETVIAQLFALPLVIVAGAKKETVVAEALPDIAAVSAVLQQQDVLGAGRHFGLGNALCSIETLDCLPPSLLRQWSAQLRRGAAPLELAGSAITVAPGREQVALRFIVGAGITPAHLPSTLSSGEAADGVGKWGMPLTQVLAQQLAQPGLDILPIARAPVALYLAPDAGRAAQTELAFSLFLSNAVRQFRLAVGDPAVVLSAHRTAEHGAEMRVSLHSVLDESLLEGFCWPLYPADDVSKVLNKINNLLLECRLGDVQSLAHVAADLNARGGRFFNARDLAVVSAGTVAARAR